MNLAIPKYILCLLALFLFTSCDTSKKIVEDHNSFSSQENQLIASGAAKDPMRLFLLTNPKDSVLLRTKSARVDLSKQDPNLELLIERMLSTVRDSLSLGVGIAAPQVGILKRVVLVQRFDKPDFPFEAYINPVIRQYSKKKQPCMEGCLSIPQSIRPF